MTKMATMPIYGKNLWKSSAQNRMADDLDSRYATLVAQALSFVQMMTLDWPWSILWQGQNLSLRLLYGKKAKQWIFWNLLNELLWIPKVVLGASASAFLAPLVDWIDSPHTTYWKSPFSILGMSGYDFNIPTEKWLNYLQTVETRNESLCLGSWSHDQDGHHVLIWLGSYLKCLQVDGIEVKYENWAKFKCKKKKKKKKKKNWKYKAF